MGMDLCGRADDRYFRFGFANWQRVLELAVAHGWEPMGTNPPPGEPGWKPRSWGYDGNEGQLVLARDARNLADAVERALTEPPPPIKVQLARIRKTKLAMLDMAMMVDQLVDSLNSRQMRRRRKNRKQPAGAPPLDDYQKKYFAEFVEFCRGGSFRIY